jgi:hypothetical protein
MNYATVINILEKCNYNFSMTDLKPREHYKFRATVCNSGFPITKSQALFFNKNVYITNRVLNSKDVDKIENLLNKYSFKGVYKLTKSKTWARLVNSSDFCEALKLELIK